nr:ribonuclease H-like domain-containing protein [Tanacetum cinerariifolium]
MPTHPMVTRAKADIFKPLQRMNCHVTTTSPLPRSYGHALCDPNWKEAMLDEYNALITNGTWVIVPHPTNGIDCDETFSPVVTSATIRTVLSLAVSRDWPIHQLDVKNVFLHGHLSDTVYMHQPLGFVDPNKPNYVCHLQRSLYGLKQAPCAWFQLFASYATRRSASGLFLSQSKFAEKILERAHMQNCNSCRTPVDTESKLGSDGDPVSDPTLYRSLAGAFQYLTFTRLDLSYNVQQRQIFICSGKSKTKRWQNKSSKQIINFDDDIRQQTELNLHHAATANFEAYWISFSSVVRK